MGKLKFLSHHLPRINPKVWQVFKRKKFFFDHVSEIYLMLFFLLKKKSSLLTLWVPSSLDNIFLGYLKDSFYGFDLILRKKHK
jgi:hypothetical protein